MKWILLSLVILVSAIPAEAMAKGKPENANTSLRYDWNIDLTVTSIAATGWLIMEASRNDIAPSSCRWCGVNSLDAWGHNNLKWSDPSSADTASSVLAYGLSPLVAFGLDAIAANQDDRMNNFLVDAMVIAESAAVSSLVSQIVKISVGRQRPDAHYGTTTSGITPVLGSTSNTSFYSGHTSLAFALAVSSGTVATMRKYELAPVIWGAGLAVAATTGYLRLAADKHYITDVIGGAVIGSAFGFGIPYLFHRPKEKSSSAMISVTPLNGGMALSVFGSM